MSLSFQYGILLNMLCLWVIFFSDLFSRCYFSVEIFVCYFVLKCYHSHQTTASILICLTCVV